MSDYFERAARIYLNNTGKTDTYENLSAAMKELQRFDLMRYALKQAEDTK